MQILVVQSRHALRGLHTSMYARNPSRKILVAFPRCNEPSVFYHPFELFLCGKAFDTFDKILVAVSISRNQLTYQRNGPKAPSLIDGIEQRTVDVTELQTGKDAARFEDPKC